MSFNYYVCSKDVIKYAKNIQYCYVFRNTDIDWGDSKTKLYYSSIPTNIILVKGLEDQDATYLGFKCNHIVQYDSKFFDHCLIDRMAKDQIWWYNV